MQPPLQHSRIDISDLKSQIVKRLGLERSKQYFYYLNRFLSLKITKVDFTKICFRIVGRENLSLHNQLITSILKNGCQAKVPPTLHSEQGFEPLDAAGKDSLVLCNKYQQTGQCSDLTQVLNSSILSNGDILSPSPRKARSGIRERKTGACANLLGVNGKVGSISRLSKDSGGESCYCIVENGNANLFSSGELMQYQELAEKQGNKSDHYYHNKLSEINASQDEQFGVPSRDSTKVKSIRIGREASSRSLLHPPLGIALCSASIGGSHRKMSRASNTRFMSSYDYGGLFDTEFLRSRIQQIVTIHGLGSVSVDCVNLLNEGLNSYMRRLIRSSIELARARSGHNLTKNATYTNHPHGKLVNLAADQSQIRSSTRPLDGLLHERRPICSVSLLDFKVAMELNPQQLGEGWPSLLEKIGTRSLGD
ncbi:hypothetical protein Nepgr_005736 [Nepenthes gracilis]|uniref:Transcriptional coactivator Hfi1/Transcriptional adapter 1 n=1 Tax=Nepenthes gracilis TaxID=150966 RepID=A0AAD3XGQ5_NEPGR|nr:hypothetical protein Nepgr_005736 [Nepenthes gracilis]